jgi:large subunit ribosomal protein L29
MKVEEIRELNDQEITESIDKLEKELMHLRMGNAIGTVGNPTQIRYKRRDIARLKTEQTARARAN